MIGLRNTVPSRIARIVPLGLGHAFLSLYSVTRSSFGVMVAHFTPTPCCWIASAACDRDRVVGAVALGQAEVVALELHVDERLDQLLLDQSSR